ncbi:hypothetical protein HRI_002424600 [Hibiscus trionum]|uniref:Reverse transcriptase n=1 Tax=Hibiscus trionum TaxID=183268 RepID=A0A9W7I1Z6_HIBTR|nr:hypothetical protein HRI_002424600 [Hibiscus trionum]
MGGEKGIAPIGTRTHDLGEEIECQYLPSRSLPDHLTHTISDHYPILVNTTLLQANAHLRSSFFKFDASWILEEGFETLIRSKWVSINEELPSKLFKLSNCIKSWSRDLKKSRTNRKNSLNAKLAELSMQDPDGDNLAQLLDVKIALNMEADKDEIFLGTKSTCKLAQTW